VFDVLPISGNSKFGGKDGKNPHSDIYNKIWKASRALVKAIFDRLVGDCPNALGIFAVGEAAFEACPALIEGLTIKLLNDRVCHPCLIYLGRCKVVSADAWIDQSLKVLKLVTGVELSIDDDERNNVCFVNPSNRKRHAKRVAKKAAAAEAKRIKDAKKAAMKAAAAEAAAEAKRIKDEDKAKRRSVQAEEIKALRKRIRLAPNNDLSFSVNLSTITTPRSTSPAKKTPVRIKFSLPKTIVTTPDESDSDNDTDEPDSDNDLSTITIPRSTSPAKKTPVRIKFSLKKTNSNTDEPDSNTNEPDSNTDEPDSNTDEPDSNTDEPDPDNGETDSDDDEPDSDDDESDSDDDESDSDTDESDSDTDESDSDTDESDSDDDESDSD
jgi:hypothetical protein